MLQRLSCVMLLMLVGTPTMCRAQDTVHVNDPAPGEAGQIALTRVTMLRVPRSAAAFDFPNTVLRDGNGFYYVLDEHGPHQLWVFDPAGIAVRTIPRASAALSGSKVRALALTGLDTLHVFSAGITVFDAKSTLIRQHPLAEEASVFRAVGLPRGQVVVQAIIRTPELFGYPLHVVDGRGAIVRSFGAEANQTFDGNPSAVVGALAPAGPERFWSANQREYRIELWTATGRLLKVIDRKSNWFRPWGTWNGRMDISPPPPRLLSVRQDSQGRLMVLTAVRARDWKAVPGRGWKGEAPVPTAAEYDSANDSVIEVIDPTRGVVVATQLISGTLVGFIGDSLVAGVSMDASNRPAVDIWRLRIGSHRR